MTTMYEVLLRPIVTEKTNYQATRLHQYTFEVRPEATRTMVREAVETHLQGDRVGCERAQCSRKAIPKRQKPPAWRSQSWLQESNRHPDRRRPPTHL